MQTEHQKELYIRQYTQREGIKLDTTVIHQNPGRKATARLMLNSFWREFGENLNKPSTLAIDNHAALFQVINDPLLDINAICISTEDKLEIVCSNVKENELDNGKTFCGSLYHLLGTTQTLRVKLGQQAPYFDADSVIDHWKPSQPDIPLGDSLGNMTDELEDGSYITEFTSGGPKNYG